MSVSLKVFVDASKEFIGFTVMKSDFEQEAYKAIPCPNSREELEFRFIFAAEVVPIATKDPRARNFSNFENFEVDLSSLISGSSE